MLVAFHGYGNDAFLFSTFVPYLEEEFTFVSIDLPYHGGTAWEKPDPFTKEMLKELILGMMQQFDVKQLSLLGYSIGGRICLCIAELLPRSVDQCVLIAPDGLVFNPFYHFVTRNKIGSALFHSFLSKDKNLRLIDRLQQYKLIDSARHRFIMHYLKTPDDRRQLLHRWQVLSLLVPDHKRLKQRITRHSIPISIYMGERDSVIPLAKAKQFMKGLTGATLNVLNKGHRVMDEETIPLIAQTLIQA